LSVLTELTQLKQLYLQGNNFTNEQRTALEAALPNLESITW